MITSRPLGSTWLKIFASGSRVAGAAAGAVAVGLVDRCWVTIRAESVEGASKVKRRKRTSELRFTENSICCKLMLVVGKRLSCPLKIVQEGVFGPIFSLPVYELFDGGRCDRERRRFPQ